MLKNALLTLALAATLSGSSGCMMRPQTAANLASAVLWTAVVVGQVSLLVAHDAHYHHHHCGHYRRWHEGRWVYQYQERWEYYDEPSGHWYFYAD